MTKPAEVPCVCATARMATRTLNRLYDDALRPAGIRTTQFSILARLDDEGPSTLTQLADRLVVDRTTLTRELGPLERRGLVAVAAGCDRRQRVVSLTEAGIELLGRSYPLWRKAQATVRDGIGRPRLDALLVELRAVVHAVRPVP